MSDLHGLSRRAALISALALAGPSRRAWAEPRAKGAPWQSLPPNPELPPGDKRGLAPIEGGQVFYADYGSGDAVLFLHGGLGSSDHWGRQIAALAATRRVIAMDTRGHGRSPLTSQKFGFGTFAQDVAALLDTLSIPTCAVVGWSDGGVTGLELAMARPERVTKLFAIGANVSPDGLIAGGGHTPTFSTYLAGCRSNYARLSPTPDRWSDLSRGMSALWRREPNIAASRLSAIRVPVTIALAAHDEIIRPAHAERIAKTIPGANLVRLPDVSHFAMLQDPEEFTKVLREFLGN